MLNASKDRLDYGAQLTPPDGFELDAAVATSYTLDLNALLAVPIALCFANTLEGDLKGEKLALLEAITQLHGKLKVFYQKGKIHNPSSYNRLYALLEPCLQAIVPDGGVFSSFHPKLWLLRFKQTGVAERSAKIQYRLLVLSRNLTFDRSWDLALCLDGERNEAFATRHNDGWTALFHSLLDQAKDFAPKKRILDDLPKICWSSPARFNRVELHVGGTQYGPPIVISQKGLATLLVVSPFVKSQEGQILGLQHLAPEQNGVKKVLCSRAEELNAIGKELLNDWDCYAINQSIVDGEERAAISQGNEDIQSQNLHAKLIVSESKSGYEWWLGSANATSAALGDGTNKPRNTELMAKLTGRDASLNPNALLEQWLEQGLFVKHEFEDFIADESETLAPALRQLTHRLIAADWVLEAAFNPTGSFDVTLTHNFELADLHEGCSITISQLDLPGSRQISDELVWKNADLLKLSSFIIVEAKVQKGELSKSELCVIHATLNIEGGDQRPQQLLQSMVDQPEKILNYVRLLLDLQPSKAQWLNFEPTGDSAQAAIAALLFSDSPLFEQLMVAAARHPQVITRIDQLMKRLSNAGVTIPAEFAQLWQHFSLERK